MPIPEEHTAELKHAYQVLNVPYSASAATIKQAYRQLIKRWHPDLYKNGSDEYAEATQMTKLINEAYAAIESAPLRFHIDAYSREYVDTRRVEYTPVAGQPSTRGERPRKMDWVEFWVRFAFGVVWGLLLSFRTLILHYDNSYVLVGIACAIVVFGLAAAKYGDDFWHSQFGRWWMWW
jgi:curved DNA-binding protein CbpA